MGTPSQGALNREHCLDSVLWSSAASVFLLASARLLASLRALDADVKYNSLQCTYHFHASGLDLEAVLDAVEEVVEDYGWRNRDHDICKDHPHEPYIVAYYVLNN